MSTVAVTKMHGTFNDFAVIDQREPTLGDLSAFAQSVCDRRGGIGADGLIVLLRSDLADARMRIFNPDGSEAEMCGNGMRCAVRFLSELGEGDHFRIETLAGIIAANVIEKGPAYRVRLNMGTPSFEFKALPFPNAVSISLGNPHVVIFRSAADDFDLVAAGRTMPQTNVHVAVVIDRHRIDARHYERGVGLTYACGTGAVAVTAAAIERKTCDSPVSVHVPGGVLDVEWDGGEAYLTGPAVRVFDAQVQEVHAVPV